MQLGINVRLLEQSEVWDGKLGVRREVDKPPYRHIGVAVATRCNYKAPTPVRYQGDFHGAMAVVPGHGCPTGSLYRRHSLNHDITRLAK